MRPLIFAIVIVGCSSVFGSEIREFDLKTVRRLGAELAQLSNTADKGATTSLRKRARDAAIAALKGRLFDVAYHYVVLDDPAGGGRLLVYALAHSKTEIILAGHFRVTVSADGSKTERVDALSNTLLRLPQVAKDAKLDHATMVQIVSNKPLETSVYTSLHYKIPVGVGMLNDNARLWIFNGDKVFELTPELRKEMGIQDKRPK
jgi:hypothetical protein